MSNARDKGLKPRLLFPLRSGSQLITEQEAGWVSEPVVTCLCLKHSSCLTWRLGSQRHYPGIEAYNTKYTAARLKPTLPALTTSGLHNLISKAWTWLHYSRKGET